MLVRSMSGGSASFVSHSSPVDRIYERIERGELALAEPLLLEMRYSARNGADFNLLAEELDALPLLSLDGVTIRRSIEAQAQLAALSDVSHGEGRR